jgi:DNA helicase-2/ATP-dependent DNA helicase PcrA
LFEEEFASRKIPYRLVGATKFYDRMEIRDAVAYARLLVCPFDDLALLRVLSKPRRGFGSVFADRARAFADEHKIPMLRALRDMPLSGKLRAAADAFARVFDFDHGALTPDAAASKLLEEAEYMKMWRESKDTDASDRIANLNELITNVMPRYDSLAEFLEHAALMTTDDNDANEFTASAVSVMTIHAAKGLEFDTVFLPAWEESVFPNEAAVGEGALEEERRLAYVALTRARKSTMITNVISRMQYGARQYNAPSRFIAEIDPAFCKTRENFHRMPAAPAKNCPWTKPTPRPARPDRMVGKLVAHDDLGSGVVIEEDGQILTVAFKNRGIKKIERRFVTVTA